MPFLIIIGIIAVVVTILNMHDNSNLEEIKNHLKANSCQNIIYSKGTYKGLCGDKIIQVDNSFTVDLEKNKTTFNFKDIKSIEKKDLDILLNKSYKIEFKEVKNQEAFYEKLKEKLNK